MIALYFQIFKQDASKLKNLKGKKKKKEAVPVKIVSMFHPASPTERN